MSVQNECIERHHHHIVETHGDLFNFASIPFKYSPFAFETTVDTIN